MGTMQKTEQKTRLRTVTIAVIAGVGGILAITFAVFIHGDGGSEATTWKTPISATYGDHRALVIMSYESDSAPSTPSVAAVRQAFTTGVRLYFNEVSRGKMTLSGVLNPTDGADVVGWVQASGTDIQYAAMVAAKAANPSINFRNYSWVFFIRPCPSCTEGGVGGSYSYRTTPDGSVRFGNPTIVSSYGTDSNVIVHEMGHTMYLSDEGAFLNCGTALYGTVGASCTTTWYGDKFDPMGSASIPAPYFHAYHREALQWLITGDVVTFPLMATGSVTYDLNPYEASSGVRIIKAQRDASSYAYIEYRQPIGADSGIPVGSTNIFNGALIHYSNFTNYAYPFIFLIDASPAGGANPLTPALEVGGSYTDSVGNFRIDVLQPRVSGKLTVQVMRL